eukprot:2598644-Amphidinium_carterae.1
MLLCIGAGQLCLSGSIGEDSESVSLLTDREPCRWSCATTSSIRSNGHGVFSIDWFHLLF